MRIVSKAPCRVDLAGGRLDIWPLYLYHPGAVTVNFSVDRYARCTIETRSDKRIHIRSQVRGGEEVFESLEPLCSAGIYRVPLVAYLLRFFAPSCGLDIATDSEAPLEVGIAGSSTLIIVLVSALNRLPACERRHYTNSTTPTFARFATPTMEIVLPPSPGPVIHRMPFSET